MLAKDAGGFAVVAVSPASLFTAEPAATVSQEPSVADDKCCPASCVQDHVASLLKPITPALQALVPAAEDSNINSAYPSSGQFLAGMALSRVATATALADPATAAQFCGLFNTALAAAQQASGAGSVDADALLSNIQPDLQDTVLNIAAAQPAGCKLHLSGEF